jgi:hypothetical protein
MAISAHRLATPWPHGTRKLGKDARMTDLAVPETPAVTDEQDVSYAPVWEI